MKKRWARRAPWECVLVAALAGGVYLNSLHGEFVFDDLIAVVDNKDVQPETPLSDVFSHDFWGQNLEDWQARPTPGAAEDPQQSTPLHVLLSRERSRVPRFVHACQHVRRAQSHKSFRPLTILSFRLSFLLAGRHWDEVPYRPTTAPAPAPAPPTPPPAEPARARRCNSTLRTWCSPARPRVQGAAYLRRTARCGRILLIWALARGLADRTPARSAWFAARACW